MDRIKQTGQTPERKRKKGKENPFLGGKSANTRQLAGEGKEGNQTKHTLVWVKRKYVTNLCWSVWLPGGGTERKRGRRPSSVAIPFIPTKKRGKIIYGSKSTFLGDVVPPGGVQLQPTPVTVSEPSCNKFGDGKNETLERETVYSCLYKSTTRYSNKPGKKGGVLEYSSWGKHK